MRWFVEVSRVGDSTPAERYCVDAKAWQAALQETRKLRGDTGPLSKFSIELLDDGYRAVDPIQKIRYLVNQAPSDAPILLPAGASVQASKPPSGAHSAPPPSPSTAPAAVVGVTGSSASPAIASSPAVTSSPPRASIAASGGGNASAKSVASPMALSASASSPASAIPPVTSVPAPPPSAGAANGNAAPVGAGALAMALAATAPTAGKGSVSAVPRPVSRRPPAAFGGEKTPRLPDVGTLESTAPTAKTSVAPLAIGGSVAPRAASASAPAAAAAPVIALVADPPRAKAISEPAPKAPVKAIGQASVRPLAKAAPSERPAANALSPPKSEVPAHRVFMTRSQEPKPEAPITYREQACAVAPGTSRDAVEALLRERWLAMKSELSTHPTGQLVQIAVFDHEFAHRPQRPPLGTLAWKDWRGDPVLGFPGFGVPSPPITKSVPPPSRAAEPSARSAEPLANPRPEGAPPVEAGEAVAAQAAPAGVAAPALAVAPAVAVEAAPTVEAAPAGAVSDAASAAVVETEPGPSPPEPRPVVRGRRRAGEDLISELFEAMHELHFARDIVTGAEFVLGVLADVIPCEYGIVSVFNINTRKFVVVRAHGPGAQGSILYATPDSDALLSQLMRRGGARAFKAEADPRFAGGRFASFRYPLEQLLCGPVRQGGRYLGLIELGNPLGGKPFHDSEINALDYICEQFADFVASRPVVLDPDVILAR